MKIPQEVIIAIALHVAIVVLIFKTVNIDSNRFINDAALLMMISLIVLNVQVFHQKWAFIDWPCHLKNVGLYVLVLAIGLIIYEFTLGSILDSDHWTSFVSKSLFVIGPGLLWYFIRERVYYDPCSIFERHLN